MNNFIKPLAVISILFSSVVGAGVISGTGNLLDQNGADFLEARLGLGDLDFQNISDLSVGATATQWHASVSGFTNVLSIYDVLFNGESLRIGGFSGIGHDGSGYQSSASNFLFNLDNQIIQELGGSGAYSTYLPYAQYDHSNYFATFGGGHDLWGGAYTLGTYSGYSWSSSSHNGYTYGGGSDLLTDGDFFATHERFTVIGLESYTFSLAQIPPTPVSEPSIIALMGLGILGLGLSRRKLKK